MKNNSIKLLLIALSLVVLGGTVYSIGTNCKSIKQPETIADSKKVSKVNNKNLDNYDIKSLRATYNFDTNDLKKLVEDSDINFIAKIEEILETDYRHPVLIPSDKNIGEFETIYSPYTKYLVKVIDGLSSGFSSGEKLILFKTGGLDQNQEFIEIFEDDQLPIVGEEYIMNVYIQEDGSLLASGHNSSVEISNSKLVNKIKQYSREKNQSEKRIQEKLSKLNNLVRTK